MPSIYVHDNPLKPILKQNKNRFNPKESLFINPLLALFLSLSLWTGLEGADVNLSYKPTVIVARRKHWRSPIRISQRWQSRHHMSSLSWGRGVYLYEVTCKHFYRIQSCLWISCCLNFLPPSPFFVLLTSVIFAPRARPCDRPLCSEFFVLKPCRVSLKSLHVS